MWDFSDRAWDFFDIFWMLILVATAISWWKFGDGRKPPPDDDDRWRP